MDIGSSFALYFAGLVVVATFAWTLGHRWAARIEAGGVFPHSRPHQYGAFLAAWVVVPALILAAGASTVQLLGLVRLGNAWVVSAAILVGIGGLILGYRLLRPSLRARNAVDLLIRRVLLTAALISILTTIGIVMSILFEAIRFFDLVSFWHFITGTQWSPDATFLEAAGRGDEGPVEYKFGSVPLFAGTLMITLIAMLVALPVGLLSAIYMAEYASPRVRGIAKPTLEVLAGIPTVVYGFFAALTVAPFIVDLAGWLGLDASYNSALAAGLVMGIMIIPLISSLSDDVINSVPDAMREGSYALGTTHSETIRQVILPAALPGIVSAFLLGLSKAIGETMIVVMAAGLRPNLTINPLEDMTTVTVRIVDALTGDLAFDSPETLSAFALGLVLFVVTLLLNLASLILVRRFRQKYAG